MCLAHSPSLSRHPNIEATVWSRTWISTARWAHWAASISLHQQPIRLGFPTDLWWPVSAIPFLESQYSTCLCTTGDSLDYHIRLHSKRRRYGAFISSLGALSWHSFDAFLIVSVGQPGSRLLWIFAPVGILMAMDLWVALIQLRDVKWSHALFRRRVGTKHEEVSNKCVQHRGFSIAWV